MNEHVHDLLALYALGGLEPDDLRQVEAHLERCYACWRRADGLLHLAGDVGASTPAIEPPVRLRAAVLERAVRTAAPVGRRSRAPSRRSPAAAQPVAVRLAGVHALATGVLAILVAVLMAWNYQLTAEFNTLRQQFRVQQAAVALISSPSTQALPLGGLGPAADSSGRAYVDPDSRNVVLIVQRLSPLEQGKTYQAWVISDGQAVPAGLFAVTRSGWGMTWLSAPSPPGSVIGVSVEPEGGSDQPSEVVLLSGS
jgi:anti-sigma-K factor RskA